MSDSDTDENWVASDLDISGDESDDSVEFISDDEQAEDNVIDVEVVVNTAPDGTMWSIDPPRRAQTARCNVRKTEYASIWTKITGIT